MRSGVITIIFRGERCVSFIVTKHRYKLSKVSESTVVIIMLMVITLYYVHH